MSTKAKPAAPPKGVIPPSAPGGRSGFLSDVIVELGFAEREAVEQAVRAARSPGTTVARVLVESGAITEEQLAHATAERYGIAYIDLASFAVEASAANLIKPSAAKRYQAVPVGFVGGGLLVAMADPADALGVNDIAVMTKMDVKPAVASRPALDALLEALPLTEDFEDGGAGSGDDGEDPARGFEAAEEPRPLPRRQSSGRRTGAAQVAFRRRCRRTSRPTSPPIPRTARRPMPCAPSSRSCAGDSARPRPGRRTTTPPATSCATCANASVRAQPSSTRRTPGPAMPSARPRRRARFRRSSHPSRRS